MSTQQHLDGCLTKQLGPTGQPSRYIKLTNDLILPYPGNDLRHAFFLQSNTKKKTGTQNRKSEPAYGI